MTGSHDVYRFGELTVEPATFRLLRNGAPVRIEPKALELLIYLVERRDRVVSKQEILDDLWNGVVVTENALTRAVAQARKALGDDPDAPAYIQTVPTRGYRFIAELEREEPVPQPVATTPAAPLPEPRRRAFAPLPFLVVLFLFGAAVLVVVMIGVITGLSVRNAMRRQSAWLQQEPPSAIAARAIVGNGPLQDYPTFSPDAQTIAYTGADPAGVTHIYRMPVDGGESVQITKGDGESQPAWSPDGQSIAFVAVRKGGIWQVPVSGGDAKQLTSFGSRPSWSPDGSEMAFQSGERIVYGWTGFDADPPSTIWILNVKAGKTEQLTHIDAPAGGHAEPSWRGDGMRLVFSSCDLESCGVYTIARNGTGLTPIFHSLNRLTSPGFDRGGRSVHLVQVRYNNSILYSRPVDPNGAPVGEPARIRASDRGVIQHVAQSLDGSRLAWALTEEGSDLFSVSPRGGEAVQITHNPTLRVTFPALSPDGTKLAYSAFAAGEDSGVWVANADGRNPRALDVGAGLKQHVQWSKSGWDVFYAMWIDRPAVLKVSLINGGSSVFRQLARGDFAPVVSPDETSVAFNRTIDGATTVWVSAIRGGEWQLTSRRDLARYPIWSPSGKLLAVQVRTEGGSAVGVVSFRGGPLRVLTHERGESWPYGWSPDEKEIAFAGCRGGVWNIYSVALAGGEPRKITSNTSLTTWFRSPAWSPARDRIVYEADSARSSLWISEPRATQ